MHNSRLETTEESVLALDLSVWQKVSREWLRQLRLMRMVRANEDTQFFQHLTTQFVLWQHATNSFRQQLIWSLFPGFNSRSQSQTAWVTRKSVIALLGHLCGQVRNLGVLHSVACEANSLTIQHDHTITSINVSRVSRLVLTHQNGCNLSCQTTNNVPIRVNDKPITACFVNNLFLCHPCFANRQHGTVILWAADKSGLIKCSETEEQTRKPAFAALPASHQQNIQRLSALGGKKSSNLASLDLLINAVSGISVCGFPGTAISGLIRTIFLRQDL
jgi:hypothetical protein